MKDTLFDTMIHTNNETRCGMINSGVLNEFIEGYAIIAGKRAGLTAAQLSELVSGLLNAFQDTTAAQALQAQRDFTFTDK